LPVPSQEMRWWQHTLWYTDIPFGNGKNCTGINILYNILENMFYFLVGYRCLWWWVQWFSRELWPWWSTMTSP
jgi:hypothetical protein